MNTTNAESDNRVENLFRWIMVLPAGLVCMILVSFPVHWVALGTFKYGDLVEGMSDEAVDNVERVIFMFFAPLVFVVAGAKVAPKHRMGVAIVLSSILVLVSGASLAYVLLNPSIVVGTPIRGAIGYGSGILGLATALYTVKSSFSE